MSINDLLNLNFFNGKHTWYITFNILIMRIFLITNLMHSFI